MRWLLTSRRLVLILVFLLGSSLSGLWSQASPSGDTVVISKAKYEELQKTMLNLQARYLILTDKVKSLQTDSLALTQQLIDLQKIIDNSTKDIADLKSQLEISYQASRDLMKKLQDLEKNYNELYDKFLTYQKSAELNLKIERSKNIWLSITSGVLGLIAMVFGGMWLWEKYIIK